MGCEDFQVMLKSQAIGKIDSVREFLSEHSNIKFLSTSFFEYRDDSHVVEFEVRCDRVIEISMRFALCNPATIDEVFLQLIKSLSENFFFDLQVMDALEDDAMFGDIKKNIQLKRSLWQADFGTEIAALGCDEAIDRYILNSKC